MTKQSIRTSVGFDMSAVDSSTRVGCTPHPYQCTSLSAQIYIWIFFLAGPHSFKNDIFFMIFERIGLCKKTSRENILGYLLHL